MKRFVCMMTAVCALILSACALPSTAHGYLSSQGFDTEHLSFCAPLYSGDSQVEEAELSEEAQTEVEAYLNRARIVIQDPVSVQSANAHRLTSQDWDFYWDSEGLRLTIVHRIQQNGEDVWVQAHFSSDEPLNTELLPRETPAEEISVPGLSTLQDQIRKADSTLLKKEGSELEFVPYEDAVYRQETGGGFVQAEHGRWILGADKLSSRGVYERMTVESVEKVDHTLCVHVCLDPTPGTAVVVNSVPDIQEIWFIESGSIMDIQPVPEK